MALIQFTSGSTGKPRGVVLSHRQLLSNLEMIQSAYGSNESSSGVFWLPFYHDMGLIGGVLATLHVGGTSHFLAPVDFVQQPIRWLEMLSRTAATISGAPNFAYEECVQRITEEQLSGLDLSHWQLAFCGAEPIRCETLTRFADKFAACGFRREALYCSYGLAEATLFVSGGRLVDSHAKDASANNAAPSCGRPHASIDVKIVDPQTFDPLADGEVGEIWISSPSVGDGYWQQPECTLETFGAYTSSGSGPYLRSGDLGHLTDGCLAVTGRLKDLIIIGGVNHYPHDLEQTIRHVNQRAIDRVAAFSVTIDGGEKLVIVVELTRAALAAARNSRQSQGVSPSEILSLRPSIRRQVAAVHQIEISDILLTRPTNIPLTSSGKIQRLGCREAYQAGVLPRVELEPTSQVFVCAPPTPLALTLTAEPASL